MTVRAPRMPARAARRLRAASGAANRVAEGALCLLGLAMAGLTLAQVVARYGLNHSIFWSEEAGRMILIALTFLGASCAWARGAHVGVDLLASRAPAAARPWLRAFVCLCGLGFGVFLAFEGYRFARFVELQVMSATGLSRSVPAAVVPVGGALLALHAAADLVETVARRRGDRG